MSVGLWGEQYQMGLSFRSVREISVEASQGAGTPTSIQHLRSTVSLVSIEAGWGNLHFCPYSAVVRGVCAQRLSRVWLFVIPWIITHQAPLSMGFFRQEYWSGVPFPPPRDHPILGIKPTSPVSPALAGWFFNTEPPGKPSNEAAPPFLLPQFYRIQ